MKEHKYKKQIIEYHKLINKWDNLNKDSRNIYKSHDLF